MRNSLLTLLLLFATQAPAYDFKALAEQHVIPGYHLLSEHTTTLSTTAKAYCEQPGDERMQIVRSTFVKAFLAWQSVQHLRFGPVQYLSREHRFALWPDKRGSVGKHLRRLQADPALQQAEFDISEKSVAIQGFSALERLLYADTPPTTLDCRIINAITANLQAMSNSLIKDWTTGEEPYISFFIQPGPQNAIYESDGELAGQILNSLYTELEMIVTQKLARPLGKNLQKARGKRAEGWRSDSALPAIAANLQACEALYQHTFAGKLADTPLAQSISQQFGKVHATLGIIALPLSQAVTHPETRALVEQLQSEVSALKGMIGRNMATELGLSLGFNSLDGD